MKVSSKVILTLALITWLTAKGEIIKNFLESVTKDCRSERVTDQRYFIVRVRDFYILRRCRTGLVYSPLMCRCVSKSMDNVIPPSQNILPQFLRGRVSQSPRRRITLPPSQISQIRRPSISRTTVGTRRQWPNVGLLFQTRQRVPSKDLSRSSNQNLSRVPPVSLKQQTLRGMSRVTPTGSAAVLPLPVQPVTTSLSPIPDVTTISTTGSFCRPYFKFQFDKTFLSSNKSIPSQPSNTIKFVPVRGSTGSTAALFEGDGVVTVWSMSYITFANKLKFYVRFKLKENYKYEDKYYNLITDGPCHSQPSKYKISVNPRRGDVMAVLLLRNKDQLDLRLKNVNVDDWLTVTLEVLDGDVRLYTDDKEITSIVGASTVKSSPCPLEIGKKSTDGEGFVGYIDTVQFNNCFGKR